MFEGQFPAGHPRINLPIGGLEVEFIVDTGFAGDIILPKELASRICGPVVGSHERQLADGNCVQIDAHEIQLQWYDGTRLTEVLAPGLQPLVGTGLLEGHHLHAELSEGGAVLVEALD